MSIQTLTDFFLWCAILNGVLLSFSFIICTLASDFVYRIHSRFFPMPRETFVVTIYSLLGWYKIIFLVLCVVPYAALRVIS